MDGSRKWTWGASILFALAGAGQVRGMDGAVESARPRVGVVIGAVALVRRPVPRGDGQLPPLDRRRKDVHPRRSPHRDDRRGRCIRSRRRPDPGQGRQAVVACHARLAPGRAPRRPAGRHRDPGAGGRGRRAAVRARGLPAPATFHASSTWRLPDTDPGSSRSMRRRSRTVRSGSSTGSFLPATPAGWSLRSRTIASSHSGSSARPDRSLEGPLAARWCTAATPCESPSTSSFRPASRRPP